MQVLRVLLPSTYPEQSHHHGWGQALAAMLQVTNHEQWVQVRNTFASLSVQGHVWSACVRACVCACVCVCVCVCARARAHVRLRVCG